MNSPKNIILLNGNIITVDNDNPAAEAVLISGDRIRFVGTNRQALSYAPENTLMIDLKEKTVIPGFNDNHVHAFATGHFLDLPCLWGKTCEEIGDMIRMEASEKPPGTLILGNAWDYPFCPNPHKSILDKAAPDHPVMLLQYSGHAAWVNSRMLKKMHITRQTKDPKGGRIVRDDFGEATGILRETAMGKSGLFHYLKSMFIPARHRKALETALKHFRENGITSVQDNTWNPMTVHLLNSLKKQEKLTCRFSCWGLGDYSMARYSMKLASYDDLWIRKGLIKYFADGAFSSRTAFLRDPYADEPDNSGTPRYTDRELDNIISFAARQTCQVAIHAIGDGALGMILDAVERIKNIDPGMKTLRLRIEHAQLADEQDILRMKELGILAAVMPFSLSMPEKDITLLGKARAEKAYPFLTLFKTGVPVSFGSDAPMELDYTPLLGMYYAVTRKNKAGTAGPLNPDECFSAVDALYCYTMGSAYAEGMENEKGSVSTGKLADLVVLSDDLTSIVPDQIKDIQVLMTMVGGKIVYTKDGFIADPPPFPKENG